MDRVYISQAQHGGFESHSLSSVRIYIYFLIVFAFCINNIKHLLLKSKMIKKNQTTSRPSYPRTRTKDKDNGQFMRFGTDRFCVCANAYRPNQQFSVISWLFFLG